MYHLLPTYRAYIEVSTKALGVRLLPYVLNFLVNGIWHASHKICMKKVRDSALELHYFNENYSTYSNNKIFLTQNLRRLTRQVSAQKAKTSGVLSTMVTEISRNSHVSIRLIRLKSAISAHNDAKFTYLLHGAESFLRS